MGSFDEKYGLNRARSEEEYEFYEDTHDENGFYTQRLRDFTVASNYNKTVEGREDSFNPRPNNIVTNHEEEQEEKPVEKKTISFKELTVLEPVCEKDAQTIIDVIKNGEPIIIKMDVLDDEIAQRVLDFTAGAVYALDGLIKKLSTAVFLAVPANVKVIIEGDENNG